MEGRPPFCPHCGRDFSGDARGATLRLSARLSGKPARPGTDAPPRFGRDPATGDAPPGSAPFDPAEAWRTLRERSGPLAPYLPLLALALAGALVGGLIPGLHWFRGAFIGAMIALSLQNKKKKS